jgi:hypothetical protein
MYYVETFTLGNRPSLLTRIAKWLMVRFEIIGYARAAAYLANQGMHEEAKTLMLEVAKLKK